MATEGITLKAAIDTVMGGKKAHKVFTKILEKLQSG
jgi:hypothetical protein